MMYSILKRGYLLYLIVESCSKLSRDKDPLEAVRQQGCREAGLRGRDWALPDSL
jgi:hypothetical protein